MRSMTGYGRGTVPLGALHLVVETTSVNRKNLDVACYLPREWQRLETEVVKAVRRFASRGRVTVSVSLQSAEAGAAGALDETGVSETLRHLEKLAGNLGVPFEPTADLLYRIASSPLSRSAFPDPDEATGPLTAALTSALEAMAAMRAAEGEALRKDLAARGEGLRARVAEIREHSSETVDAYREGLIKRLRQAGLDLDLSDERVLKEIALFADRIDISEELIRLDSHLEQWRELLDSSEPVGRPLEFLLQEIGRETNTIASKSNSIAVSRCAMESKNELEKMREQVQNVE